MSISDGQPVSAATDNAAFMSRTSDTDTTGTVTLKNTSDANSGSQVTNTQRAINETFDAVGMTGEGDATRNNYSSNNYVTNGEDRKEAIGSLDAGIKSVSDNLAAHEALSSNLHGLGAGETIVGDSTTQTLTNKTIDADNNTISNLAHGAEVDSPSSGVHGVTGNIVGTTDTQTLTNKTIARATNTITENADIVPSADDGFDLGSAASSYAEGHINKIYLKSNSQTTTIAGSLSASASVDYTLPPDDGTSGYVLSTDGSGSLSWTSSSSGVGGFSLEGDPNAQSGVGDWTLYNDASATPVDLTGGTVSGSVTFDTDSTGTSIGIGNTAGEFRLNIGASSLAGHGVSKLYQIPNRLKDKGYITVQCHYFSSTATSNGDFIFAVYDVSNSTLLQTTGLTDGELTGVSANGTHYFSSKVYISNNTSQIYLGFHLADNTYTGSFRFNSLIVGDDKLIDAPIVESFESVTMTGSWSTSTYTCYMKRINDVAEITGSVAWVTGSTGTLTLIIPNSLTIDTNKLVNNSDNLTVGTCSILDSGTVAYTTSGVRYNSTTNVTCMYDVGDGTAGQITDTAPITFASGDIVFFKFQVPISEWANQNAVLSTTEMINLIPDATESTQSTFISYPITADTFGDLTSITLNPGKYHISGAMIAFANGAVTTGDLQLFVTTTSGNSSTGRVFGKNWVGHQMNSTNGNYLTLTLPTIEVEHTVSTTYYLKSRAETSVSNLEACWQIMAVKQPDFSVYSVYNDPNVINIVDGTSTPDTIIGYGRIYIDSSDGDLKIKFGDGTVKTIVTDT